MEHEVPEIRSGQFDGDAAILDYRSEQVGQILIERVVWGDRELLTRYGVVVAGPGYIWFRFWLPSLTQVVERYFTPDGSPAGTLVDVCMPIQADGAGYRAADLLLDLWLTPDGRVTLHNEAAFEEAAGVGLLSAEETAHAEEHLRVLTAAIAQERFPPPLVRNWQVDVRKIQESIRERPSAAAGGADSA